jgi:hypothetical protein
MEKEVFNAISLRVEMVEETINTLCRRQGDMALEEWLDGQDVCEMLNISKRTLQSYRDRGIIPFARINYKIFYNPKDVEKVLRNYHYPKISAL